MRKRIVVTLALLLCFTSASLIEPPSARLHATTGARAVLRHKSAGGEVIVKFKENAFPNPEAALEAQGFSPSGREDHLMRLAESVGGTAGELRSDAVETLAPNAFAIATDARVKEVINRYGFDRTVVMRFDPEADLEAVVAELRANVTVEYAEPNYPIEVGAVLPTDPRFEDQWALRNLGLSVGGYPATLESDIKATEAWEITTGSPAVLVAVTDTGIDLAHPDLAPNIYTNPGEIPNNNTDDDNNGYIDDVHGYNVADRNNDISDVTGHGTEMSGIIAAKMDNGIGITGVSQSRIIPVKFFRRTGPAPEDVTATVAWAARALLYSIAAGADIINASWSQAAINDTELQTLRDAVSAVNDAGILLVCIAGNNAANLDFFNLYPAKLGFANQIVVAASEYNDDLWHPPFDPFNFQSGYGKNSVDLAAPGVTILTTTAHGNCLECSPSADPADWYRVIDGTSAAAAYVSGVAALVKSHYPTANVTAIKRRILESAEPRAQLRDLVRTGGRLNAFGALTIELRVTPPVLTRLKIKGNGKTFVFGDNIQDGATLIIGAASYTARYKNGDLSRLVVRIPAEAIPVGTFQVIIRNPDGGESLPLTITR